MEMVFHEKKSEISAIKATPSDAPALDAVLQDSSDEDNKVTVAAPGAGNVKKISCRAAAVCLALLCLLLVIGLKILVSQLIRSNSEREMKMVLLHNSYNNLTKEQGQLQTSFNSLTRQKDQLETSYNQLVVEKDQLQGRFEALTKDRHDLQEQLQDTEASCRNLTEEKAALQEILNNFNHYSRQGWMYFSGSSYQISTNQKNWQNSRNDCRQKGADLIIINSKEEQDFTRQFKKNMWIGLTDSETEGTWKWVDGTPLTKGYWDSGEPNGRRNENCADTKFYDNENSWNDERCSTSLFWICEKNIFP